MRVQFYIHFLFFILFCIAHAAKENEPLIRKLLRFGPGLVEVWEDETPEETARPTTSPTDAPTVAKEEPTTEETAVPETTNAPTVAAMPETTSPTSTPTVAPTNAPTVTPTDAPTVATTAGPTVAQKEESTEKELPDITDATDAPTVVEEEQSTWRLPGVKEEVKDVVLTYENEILQVVPTVMDMLGCPLNCTDSDCNEYVKDILSNFVETKDPNNNHYVQCAMDKVMPCVEYAQVTLGGVIGRLLTTGIHVNCLTSCKDTPFECKATTDCVAKCIPEDTSATDEDLLTVDDVVNYFGEECVQFVFDNAANFVERAQQNGGVDVGCLIDCGQKDTRCVQLLTCAKMC